MSGELAVRPCSAFHSSLVTRHFQLPIAFLAQHEFQLLFEHPVQWLLRRAGALTDGAAKILRRFVIDADLFVADLQGIERAEQRLEAGIRQAKLLGRYLERAQAIGAQKNAASLARATRIVHYIRAQDRAFGRILLSRRSREPRVG